MVFLVVMITKHAKLTLASLENSYQSISECKFTSPGPLRSFAKTHKSRSMKLADSKNMKEEIQIGFR